MPFSATAAMPLVSCIIVFLNEEAFLHDAIESVLSQTYAHWELLLVDDGSTDGSGAIARSYAAANPEQIRYLAHDDGGNRGISATRNLGLRHARGDYVAFLDGDDVWLPDKLAEQIALFERYPDAVMVCGATEYWYEWEPDSPLGRDQIIRTGDVRVGEGGIEQDRLYQPAELLKRLYPLGRGSTPSTSGFMFTRQLANAVGGFENSFHGLFDDQVFQIKTFLHGAVYVSSACFDRYRQHSGSCVHMSRASGRNVEARQLFLRWLNGYLDQVGCRDGQIRRQWRWLVLRWTYPMLYKALLRLGQLVPGRTARILPARR